MPLEKRVLKIILLLSNLHAAVFLGELLHALGN